MSNKDLDIFINVTVTRFNLKTVAENLGFTNNNGVLFVRDDGGYEVYIKFDEEYLAMWTSGGYRKIIKKYIEIYDGINNGLYLNNKEFLKNALNLLSF